MPVFAKISTYGQIDQALHAGVDGIGCLRSDILFQVDNERLELTRSILLAGSAVEAKRHLERMYVIRDLEGLWRSRRQFLVFLVEGWSATCSILY